MENTSIYEASIYFVTKDKTINDKILETIGMTENIVLKHFYWCNGSFFVECFINVEAESENDAIRKIEATAPNIYNRWGWDSRIITKKG